MSTELELMKKEIEELKLANAKLTAAKTAPSMGLKLSTKGGLSVYGLGRFPVTLYKSQWLKLLDKAEDIRKFLDDNASLLKEKE